MKYTGKQKRYLKAQGSLVKPQVAVGKDGITPAVISETKDQLQSRELIKVKVQKASPVEPDEAGSVLAEKTGSELVEVKGRSLLLFLPKEENSSFELP